MSYNEADFSMNQEGEIEEDEGYKFDEEFKQDDVYLDRIQDVVKCDGYELISQFMENIEKIIEKTCVTKGVAQTYLFESKHDLELAIENIIDKYSYSVVSKNIGIAGECPSCLCPVTMSEVEIFECQHFICRDCLRRYVESEISQGSNSVLMRCPQEGCKEKLSYDLIRGYSSKKMKELFEKFLISYIVLTSNDMLACPGPDCKNIIKHVKGNKIGWIQRDITCNIEKCRYCFCSLCKSEGHMPLACNINTKWLQKLSKASELWILLGIKPCPNCNINIQKSSGCMHMTCALCKHQFCWLCLGAWKAHGKQTGGLYSCKNLLMLRNICLYWGDGSSFSPQTFLSGW